MEVVSLEVSRRGHSMAACVWDKEGVNSSLVSHTQTLPSFPHLHAQDNT